MKNKNLIGISGKIGTGKDLTAKIINWLIWKENCLGEDSTVQFMETWYPKASDGGYEVKKFAGKLKEIVCLLTGCTMADLESQEFKSKSIGDEWKHWQFFGAVTGVRYTSKERPKGNPHNRHTLELKSYTYRELLQYVGTDALRNVIHEDVWVNALFSEFKPGYFAAVDPYNGINVEKENVVVTTIYPKWLITDVRFPNELEAIKKRGGITIRLERDNSTQSTHESETALDNAKFDYVINNDGTIENLVEKVREILKQEEIL